MQDLQEDLEEFEDLSDNNIEEKSNIKETVVEKEEIDEEELGMPARSMRIVVISALVFIILVSCIIVYIVQNQRIVNQRKNGAYDIYLKEPAVEENVEEVFNLE